MAVWPKMIGSSCVNFLKSVGEKVDEQEEDENELSDDSSKVPSLSFAFSLRLVS